MLGDQAKNSVKGQEQAAPQEARPNSVDALRGLVYAVDQPRARREHRHRGEAPGRCRAIFGLWELVTFPVFARSVWEWARNPFTWIDPYPGLFNVSVYFWAALAIGIPVAAAALLALGRWVAAGFSNSD